MRHFLAGNDCSSYVPTVSLNDGSDAPERLANYGACAGENALENGLINSGVVQDIESGIAKGVLEAAQLTGMLTVGLSMLNTVGITTVAVSSVVPVVGFCAAIVLSIANALQNVFGDGPQIYVPNPYASPGNTTISYGGIRYERISTKDYVTVFVPNAMNWLNDPVNMPAALVMSADTFSANHNVFLDASTPAQLAATDLNGYANPLGGPNQYAALASSGNAPPGAYEMLRAVQLPAASAVVASLATYAMALTAGNQSGNGAPLLVQFPALRPQDMISIFNATSIQHAYNTNYTSAQVWASTSTNYPISAPDFAAKFKLSVPDTTELLNKYAAGHWYDPTVSIVDYGGSGSGSGSIYGTPAKPGSAIGKVATGAATVAGIAGIGLLAYKLYTGYTFAKTLHSLYVDTKKVGSKIASGVRHLEPHHKGRRSNPLDRSLATGGRDVLYRAFLGGERDVVVFEGPSAVLYRDDRRIAAFHPSSFQKTKIRAGRGELLIFSDQIEGK